MQKSEIAALINESPMNRGMDGEVWLSRPGNKAIVTESGNVLLFELCPQMIYEFHWLHTPTRGRTLVEETKRAFAQVFEETGSPYIYGLIPEDRRDSILMAYWIGAKTKGSVNTRNGMCKIFEIANEGK